IHYCQLYPAVLQHLRQYSSLYQVKLALLILKSQLSLLASAPAHSILIYSFSSERPMTIEMQDMHRPFLILQAITEISKRGRAQELNCNRAVLDMFFHFVEEFASYA